MELTFLGIWLRTMVGGDEVAKALRRGTGAGLLVVAGLAWFARIT